MVAVNVNPPSAEPGIDMRTLFKQLNFEPHSQAQWDYCESKARFNVPCCGRRWGKSIATGHRFTYKAFVPDTYNWIVGPTYTLAEKEFRIVYKDFEKLGLLKYCKKAYSVKQGDMRITTPWNTHIQAVSAEKPDSLLGEGLSHVCMSESAKHSQMVWEQYIEPALSDFKGSADFPSTPQGYNWYHGLWLLGQQTGQQIYKSWRFPTWTNPIRFPGGATDVEIMRIRATVSKNYFDQEYAAMFTTFAGAIYDEWNEQIHVKPHTYNPNWNNYMSMDFGFANPFVALDIQVDQSDNIYVWREYYERYLSTYEHGNILKARENPTGYTVDAAWGDPRGADEIATLAIMLGYIAAQDVPWKLGVEAIKRLLKVQSDGFPKLFIDPSCSNLIRQMGQLHIKERTQKQKLNIEEYTGDGNIQHKVDDHAADALRYFVGPYFVLGAGSHLEDTYGGAYEGSEAESFFKLHSSITLGNQTVGYNDIF